MQYAQALMMMGTEEKLQDAKRQVEYLVSIDPQGRNYRLLLTVIAAQLGDTDVAFSNFALIKDQLSSTSDLYTSLVAELRKLGASEELLQLSDTSAPTTNPTVVSNAASDNAKPSNKPQSDIREGGPAFDVAITIADELVNKLPSSGYLIVFAQDANSGARMPLAVKKLALASFPTKVNLSSSDAMITNFSLKNAEQVTITARISMDEDVMTSKGELQGRVSNLDVTDSTVSVDLLIDEEVQ
jgi:hypothetical protein